MEGDRFVSGNSNNNNNNRNDSPFMLKQSLPGADEDDGDDDSMSGSVGQLSSIGPERDRDGASFNTRAGSLEMRLRPTLNSESRTSPGKQKALSVHAGDGHSFRLFRSSATVSLIVSKMPSRESLRAGGAPGPGGGRAAAG